MADESKGGAAVATKPESKQQQKPAPKAPVAVADDKPVVADPPAKLGEDVFYVLSTDGTGKDSPNKGQRRAAKVVKAWDDGTVNLHVFAGRGNDFATANNGFQIHAGAHYDPDGAPGTWHREEDPAAAKD